MTDEEKLLKAYESVKKKLERSLKAVSGGDMKNYYRQLIKEIDKAVKELRQHSAAYANASVPKEYIKNANEIFEQFNGLNIPMKPPEAFRQLHSDAIYDLRKELAAQLEQGIAKARLQTERLLREAKETAEKAALRSIALDAAQKKINTVGTITDMQLEVKKSIEDTGILKVEIGSGERKRRMSITNYAHLAARSVSREVGNTARINQISANGFDLAEIPSHYPTCEICAILQDRVYSISGKDKRFPPLSKAIGEYKNIHPHCRHVIVGWAETAYTPEEVKQAIERSNRSWADPRTGEEKAFYNELQKRNRRARDLRSQFERYKTRLGDSAPKSVYAFKRIKNAGGEKWENLQAKYRRTGKANIKNLAKFDDIFALSNAEANFNISPQEVLTELEKSEVGKKAIDQLDTLGVRPLLDFETKTTNMRGEQKGNRIIIYMLNISTPRIAAQTVIHETTHLYYDIGNCQWAEAVCMAKEKMHIMNRSYLTIAEKRYIINLVKQNYLELNWKKGGYKYGRNF